MSQFSVSFLLAFVVAFFAPIGFAASDTFEGDRVVNTSIAAWAHSSSAYDASHESVGTPRELSNRLSSKLNQRPTHPRKPNRPTSNSFGEHDAQGILSSWRWFNSGHESREQEAPDYTQIADLGASCYIEQFVCSADSRLLTPFYFRHAASQHRLSGWKDGNTLYVYLSSLYA
ncbi:hypothetical protein [Vibrio variabilis]|uniref:hypothetical protein n=1 Tax=Vibrio variabilis TaxID=990271 RepID=UPI0013A6B81A|nr:hypothetical protein [Vibrio variabilis]